MPTTLRLILGDQLNASHSWYRSHNEQVLYLIAELTQELGYVRHHVQKICAFFAAMEAFATSLEKAGHRVLHLTLDDTAPFQSLPDLLQHLLTRESIQAFEYQRPDEYRLLEQLRSWSAEQAIPIHEVDTEHFLLPFAEIDAQFKPNRAYRMEYFYRRMRQRYQLLMQDNKPLGGRWNFDADNRQSLKPADIATVPAALCFSNDVGSILSRLDRHQVPHFGKADNPLPWPVSRKQAQAQAQALLTFFCAELLPFFGRFQDAMTSSFPGWSLYHSRLSFALNSKMLHPKQVLDTAIAAWQDRPEEISLAQIEGFTRQILGWREFVRGIYWTGDTQMHCMRACLNNSLDHAYAHHIQRLMVIGNFCLLCGIEPDQVDQWYLGVYIDAIEWVEIPNTRGMSQFADGGLVASKLYISGGNYIRKMSDYCSQCPYDIRQSTGSGACPFNSLYWAFIHRHQHLLQRNPRMSLVWKNWQRKSPTQQTTILATADAYLKKLENL